MLKFSGKYKTNETHIKCRIVDNFFSINKSCEEINIDIVLNKTPKLKTEPHFLQ